MIVLAMVAALAGQPEAPLAQFDFRELTSTTSAEQARAAGALGAANSRLGRCVRDELAGREIQQCSTLPAWNARGISNQPISYANIMFDAEGMVVLNMALRQESLATIEAALRMKYGEPCQAEERTWRNELGAELENPVWTWCFADGRLELVGRSSVDPRMSQLGFVARRLQLNAGPVVDF